MVKWQTLEQQNSTCGLGFEPSCFTWGFIHVTVICFMLRTSVYGLDQLQNMINTMKELASKSNKDPNSFKVILLTYPKIAESRNSGGGQRFPMTGTIEEIGADIRVIKDMGVGHIVLGFFFSPIYENIDKTIEISRQLMHYAR